MDKSIIRENIKRSLKSLSEKTLRERSDKIILNLENQTEWHKMNCLYSFLPFGQEPLIEPLLNKLLEKRHPLFAPRTGAENSMNFYPLRSLENCNLDIHKWGIREPKPEKSPSLPPPGEKAIMLVPGCAFSPNLLRLGRGGGFYDRYFSRYRENFFLIGLCFEEQIVLDLPVEEHDIPMNLVITDKNIYR